MKPRIRPSITPQCSACIRNCIDNSLAAVRRPLAQYQTRGAKTSKKPDAMPVVLLEDIDGFGKKGAFVPIPRGTMRNSWFPASKARYATLDEHRAIKRGEIDCIRDHEFEILRTDGKTVFKKKGSEEEAWKAYLGNDTGAAAAAIWKAAEGKMNDITIKHIEPSRAIEVLDNLLPDVLTFERKPVPKPVTPESEKSKLPASVQAMLKASLPEERVALFGSVSTTDIANLVRETVSYNDEAATIPITESSVKFIDLPEGDDPTRVKHLGKYQIDISFKGAEKTLSRKVEVVEPHVDSGEDAVHPTLASPPAQELQDEVHR